MIKKVLIVDDNEDMLDTLEHLFKFYDFDTVRALNGKEGVKLAESEQPDIIILDALMPVMNGFDACKLLMKILKRKIYRLYFSLPIMLKRNTVSWALNWVLMTIF